MWHVRGGRENMWVKVKKTQQETQQENRNTGKGKEEFLQPYNVWIYSAVTFGGDSSTAVQFVFRESHPSPKKYLSFSKIDVGFHTAGLCNGKFM